MAHGFRHVPRERKAAALDVARCNYCHARLDTGLLPHICKKVTWGTALAPTGAIPFDAKAGQ